MPQGYYAEEPDFVDDALDELLCEYVDGTMDPVVRDAFEEYLESNPDLAAHARCLCETRDMLCRYGKCRCASLGMQAQLRIRLAHELDRDSRNSVYVSSRLSGAATLTSAVSLVLILGMMTGLFVTQRYDVRGNPPQDSALGSDSMTILDDTYRSPNDLLARGLLSGELGPGFTAPLTVLPVVASTGYMTPSYWPYQAADSTRKPVATLTRVISP
jgi:hypothetical protein